MTTILLYIGTIATSCAQSAFTKQNTRTGDGSAESAATFNFTEPRKFSLMLHLDAQPASAPRKKGSGTTFELKILFRQHSSWQGILLWKEKRISHNFRSVLELVILIDSALRSAENSGCA